jgi:hypothetical protein
VPEGATKIELGKFIPTANRLDAPVTPVSRPCFDGKRGVKMAIFIHYILKNTILVLYHQYLYMQIHPSKKVLSV